MDKLCATTIGHFFFQYDINDVHSLFELIIICVHQYERNHAKLVILRDISIHVFRIYIKITILTIQEINATLLFKHVYVYAIDVSYDNTIQFVLENDIILI